MSVGSPTLMRTAELLGPRLASLDPIERAVALREWESALSMPVRWGAAADWSAVPESSRARLLAGQAVEIDAPRRVMVVVPRDGRPAQDGDLLVVGPLLKPAPALSTAAAPAGVSAGSAAEAQAGVSSSHRVASSVWPSLAGVFAAALAALAVVGVVWRSAVRSRRVRWPVPAAPVGQLAGDVIDALPSTPVAPALPAPVERVDLLPSVQPGAIETVLARSAPLPVDAFRVADPAVAGAAVPEAAATSPVAARVLPSPGLPPAEPSPVVVTTEPGSGVPAAALPALLEKSPVPVEPPSASAAPQALAPERAAPRMSRDGNLPPLPWMDGPVQLGPPVTVPGAPHRLGTLLRETPQVPVVTELGDLAALLRGEVERVRRQCGELPPADGAEAAASAAAPSRLVIDYDPWLEGPVAHQPALMRRAVRNLLKAAAERATRHVVLSARIEAEREVVIEVDDDGPIVFDEPADHPETDAAARPANAVPRRSPAADDDGGLAFVSSVAQWHGGRTGVERSPLGGVRCVLRWPVQLGAGNAGAATAGAANAGAGQTGPAQTGLGQPSAAMPSAARAALKASPSPHPAPGAPYGADRRQTPRRP
jgi:hypothetical protein